MKKTRTSTVLILNLTLVLGVVITARAASITVGYGAGYDFATIQPAIDAAGNYDTVIVADGTYPGNLDFKGKPITVQSENGADTCIVDCPYLKLSFSAARDRASQRSPNTGSKDETNRKSCL